MKKLVPIILASLILSLGFVRVASAVTCPSTYLSVAAKKGTSLAVETEPGAGLRSGPRWAQE